MKTPELITALKNHYKKTGISQEELSRRIGVDIMTLNRWFNGRFGKLHHVTELAIESFLKAVQS